jgi:AcrR family transcriptional regulator
MSTQASTDLTAPVRRLRRTDRREQILVAAARAFARTGFSATSLDDVASEAGVSRAILYRHFNSKTDLYRAILERACLHLSTAVGRTDFSEQTIPTLLHAASADPDGFRLLFRYAAREPEFRDMTEALTAAAADIAGRHVKAIVADQQWARWAGQLASTLAIEAVIAWLDAGQPDPRLAAHRIGRAVGAVIEAAQAHG